MRERVGAALQRERIAVRNPHFGWNTLGTAVQRRLDGALERRRPCDLHGRGGGSRWGWQYQRRPFVHHHHDVSLRAQQPAGAIGGYFKAASGSEMQFAKGRFVAVIFCYTPYGDGVSAECDGPVRLLAERWYAQLPSEG